MKKIAIFSSLIVAAILLQSCGEVKSVDIEKAVLTNSIYLVNITVNISESPDPMIYIYAKEAIYNPETKTLVIKEGYLGSMPKSPSNAAIYIEEAVFYFKFPTTVTIKNLPKN